MSGRKWLAAAAAAATLCSAGAAVGVLATATGKPPSRKSAAASSGAGASRAFHTQAAHVSATPPTPSLAMAEREARDVGPVSGDQTITLTLTLRARSAAADNALLAKGGRVTPARWAKDYGPAPALVRAVRASLSRAGVTSRWQSGEVSLSATGLAGRVESFFHLQVDNFVMHDGTRFYAPLRPPAVPKALSHEVVAVTGGDNYHDYITAAIAGPNGVTPAQMTNFYDLSPLRNAGIDGSGQTVMFPEWAMPTADVLAAYANKFKLPPFDVSEVTNPSVWGAPAVPGDKVYPDVAGEAALDLEVVHGLAPGAKEIVYALGNSDQLPAVLQTMFQQHPGTILSSSIFSVSCEQDQGAKAAATAADSVFAQGSSEGTSIFWAAGDRGVFACISDGNSSTEGTISISPQGASPHLTSVGGTTVFLASNGLYYKESAWGEPIEQWGGGGGFSTIFPRPSWQIGPGTSSLTGRGIPDISANADIESGWDTFNPPGQGQKGPQEGPVGGTSAATPCLAAMTALIDQFLKKQGLKTVGFANPALYFFGTSPHGMPAQPFHAITEGTNLHYSSAAGWNPATGLGSPDVAHLADDFVWYDKDHGGSP